MGGAGYCKEATPVRAARARRPCAPPIRADQARLRKRWALPDPTSQCQALGEALFKQWVGVPETPGG